MSNTTTAENSNVNVPRADWKEKIIGVISDNLIVLGIIIVFLSQGIISIKTSIVNTDRLNDSNVVLKNLFTLIGVFVIFAGLLNRFDGFKKVKHLNVIYPLAGLVISLFVFFSFKNKSAVINRIGCNKEFKRSYLWFNLDNSELRGINPDKTCMVMLIQKCFDETYQTANVKDRTNTELLFFNLKELSEPTTFYTIYFNDLADTLKVGTPIMVDMYLVDKSFVADKNKSFNDLPNDAVRYFEKRKAHVSVEDYNFTGISAILRDNLNKLNKQERDSISSVISSFDSSDRH